MGFKFIQAAVAALSLLSCTGGSVDPESGIIGENLEKLSIHSSSDKATAAFYNKQTERILQFDVDSLELKQKIKVRNPHLEHYILADEGSNYLVDLSKEHLSIYRSNGTADHDPIYFTSNPISAAFDQKNDLIVIYDEDSTVIILDLNEQGEIDKIWSGGPTLENKALLAGDLNSKKQLILSFTDGDIGIVDIEATLENEEWVFTSFPTEKKGMDWIAPLHDDLIIARSLNEVLVIDLKDQSVVQTLSVEDYDLIKRSKSGTPHLVYRDKVDSQLASPSDSPIITHLFYYKDGSIVQQDRKSNSEKLLYSHLVADEGHYSIITSNSPNILAEDTPLDEVLTGRTVMSFRLSDLRATRRIPVKDHSLTNMVSGFFLNLHPSTFGYLERHSLDSGKIAGKRGFHLGELFR